METKLLVSTAQRPPRGSITNPEAPTPTFQFNDHFIFEGLIGRSQRSEVHRVRHRMTGEIYAIKRSRQFRSSSDRDEYLREIMTVASLQSHPNVVSVYRAWQENAQLNIQMQYCSHGALSGILQQ